VKRKNLYIERDDKESRSHFLVMTIDFWGWHRNSRRNYFN